MTSKYHRPAKPRRRTSRRAYTAPRHGKRIGLALALGSVLFACAPLMVEREGHRVFNPDYLPWLDHPRRDAWQQPEAVLDALDISEGAIVADVGAGGGYFAERVAARVGPAGRVYATDVQDEMIEALERRVRERRLDNVRVVRAAFDDPTLPAACCDLVFFSHVYKEIDNRVDYMKRVARVLRPGARIAILEFRPGAPGAGPPPGERLTPETVSRELADAGFALVASHDFPRQYLLVFTRDHA
ncbi:MAG: methyltransferase domain-containing protein [Myxococcales bacterium]|nr:methyltransferase domain-containing protein [Myxococcales bacterium]